jgi:hypothetical protein
MLKFENPEWINDPELLKMLVCGITAGQKSRNFGRQDTPGVGQIGRAAIYKGMKHPDYRASEYAQEYSGICEQFVKINPERPYSFQVI